MFGILQLAFVQRGILEVLLVSLAAGLLGTWIVLRGLAFYTHAASAATFPGLVLAAGVGISPPLAALLAALAFALGLERLARRRPAARDSLTAIALAGALAAGAVLASDVFHSGSEVDTLLFGSLLATTRGDLLLAGLTSAAALVAVGLVGRRWLALGFDRRSARALGLRSPLPDILLLVIVAVAIVAVLASVGALLATALLVIPAATVRLWRPRLRVWQVASVGLVALEGVAGVLLAVETDAPPGSTIAVLAGAVFALSALALWVLPRRRGLVAAAAAGLLLVPVGAAAGGLGGGSRPVVVATTTQIADWTRAVAGPGVDVHQILRPNTDPHAYEPRPADVEAAGRARLVLENGDGLDHWTAAIVRAAGGSPRLLDLAAHVPVRLPGRASGPEASRTDPHWWHDPRNAEAAVRAIRDALAATDPAAAGTFRRRAAAYLARLRALDRGIAHCLRTIPRADRLLVTDHDAFGYLAARYGLRVVGAVIPSQSTQGQASAGDVASLIRLIEREHVAAIFPETSLNAALAHEIAAETGARSDLALYGDTLGPAGSPGATYLGMERANADAISRGLGGAPCGGGGAP